METGRDFRSIIHSVPFTFLVGQNHTKLTIQSGLARHVSRPLDHLMNSGQTRESKHQIAVLEDEDVETFVAFCEYAYTGDYSVPPPGFREEDREQDILNNPFRGMFSGESSPISVLAQSPMRTAESPGKDNANPTGGDDDGYGNGYFDYRNGSGDMYQECQAMPPQYHMVANQHTWYLSTTTAYPQQDPTATPMQSNESETHSATSSPSRGRRRRKSKTSGRKKYNQKNQVLLENPPSKLTPPNTPPPDTTQKDIPNPSPTQSVPVLDESGQEQKSGEEDNVSRIEDASSQKETWERSASASASASATGEDMEESTEEYLLSEDPRFVKGHTRPIIDTSFANQEFSSHREKGTSLWDEFTAFEDAEPRPYFRPRPTNTFPGFGLPYLVFHAKVYVFATRYLIPDLAHLCLRKLHRDLLNLNFPDTDQDNQYAEQFVLTTTKARMILDLLHYTYTTTTRLEPISPTAATQLRDNELRRLVVHYAACKMRDLAEYCPPMETVIGSPSFPEKPSARGLRALLDTIPELASDLIYRMI